MTCLPICLLAGRNLATATFVNGLIVALTVAISDAVRRGVAEDTGVGIAVHAAAAFATYVVLHVVAYLLFAFGKANVADTDLKRPSCNDFWGCPEDGSQAGCWPWFSQLSPRALEGNVEGLMKSGTF